MYFSPLDIRRIIYPRASGLITFDRESERAAAGRRASGKKAKKPKAKTKPIVKKPEAKKPKAQTEKEFKAKFMAKATRNLGQGDGGLFAKAKKDADAAWNNQSKPKPVAPPKPKPVAPPKPKPIVPKPAPKPPVAPVQPTPTPPVAPVQPTPGPKPRPPKPGIPYMPPVQPYPQPLQPGSQPAIPEELISPGGPTPMPDPNRPRPPNPFLTRPQPAVMPETGKPGTQPITYDPMPGVVGQPMPGIGGQLPNTGQPLMPDQMPDPTAQPTVAKPAPTVTTVDDYYDAQQPTGTGPTIGTGVANTLGGIMGGGSGGQNRPITQIRMPPSLIPPKLQAFLDANKASMQGDMDQAKKDQQVVLAKYNVKPGEQPTPEISAAISKEMEALPSVKNIKAKQKQSEAELQNMPEYQTMQTERENLLKSGQDKAALQNQQLQAQLGNQTAPIRSATPDGTELDNYTQSAKPVSFDEQMAQFTDIPTDDGSRGAYYNQQNQMRQEQPGQANTNVTDMRARSPEEVQAEYQAAQQQQQQQGADVGRNLNNMTTQQQQQGQQQDATTDPVPSDREATLNTNMQKVTDIQTELNTLSNDPILSEVDEEGQPTEAAKAAQQKITAAQTRLQAANVEAQNAQAQANLPRNIAKRDLTNKAITDPASLAKQSEVAKVDVQAEQFIKKGTGQAGPADQANTTVGGPADQTAAPDQVDVTKVDPTMVTDKAKEEADKVKGATGEVSTEVEAQEGELSDEAKADGQKFDQKNIDTIEGGTRKVTAEEEVIAQGGDEEAVKTKIAQANVPDNIKAAQTKVQPEELPDAAQIKEADMAQAKAAVDEDGLDERMVAARLEAFTVDAGTLAEAAQGDVKAQDTVQGQLSSLMASFDDGTPAWAAGAMRAANSAMASRGMGGSSMAGAAIFQAAMESALPIAMQDAQTFSQMNMANLNNRQQVSLSNAAAQQGLKLQNLSNEQQAALQNSTNSFSLQSQNLSNTQQTMLANAQIKASLQGQNLSNQQQSNLVQAARYAEVSNLNLNNRQQAVLQDNSNAMSVELANLNTKQQAYLANAQLEAALQGKQIDNRQQAAIMNASKFSDANNLTFTAQEQAKVHNSELMKTIGLAELNSAQAATLQNAAATASMDMANLSNRQQAQVQNAQNFLAMDMANLSNDQQAVMFKAQAVQTALLSDQAADNAAKQFNAASQNQADQFMAGLTTDVAKFNTAQVNAAKQFDAGEINATEKFNAQMKNQRTEFNSKNALIVSQANAQWRQNIATLDQAAQNDSNMLLAKSQNAFTQSTVDQIWQRERDIMSMAWKSSESESDRIVSIITQQLANDGSLDVAKLKAQAEAGAGIGAGIFGIISALIPGL